MELGIKKIVVGVLLSLASVGANAALPDCWPMELGGEGSLVVMGETAKQRYIGWTCGFPAGGNLKLMAIVGIKSRAIKNVGWTKITNIEAATKYWNLNVLEDPKLPKYAEGYDELRRVIGLPPLARN